MPKSPKNIPGNSKRLLERIKTNFPDVAGNTYKYIDEGWDHEVLIVDNTLVFRFPDDDEYLAQLKIEVSVLKRLKPFVTINIPDYTHIAPDVSFAGYPLIPGETLTREYFDSLKVNERDSFARQLSGFMSVIHTLIASGRDFNDVPLTDIVDEQANLKVKTKEHLKNMLNDEDFAKVTKIIAETDKLLSQKLPSVFIHGDIYHRHLLWDKTTKMLGVIDFSDMNRGDPAFDFAELYEYGEEFVNRVYDYYTGPKDKTLLQRAWTYGQWVGVYMMVDYFEIPKTSFEKARETFDRVKG